MLLSNVMLVLSLFLVLAASGIGSVSATARVPLRWSSKEEKLNYTRSWLRAWTQMTYWWSPGKGDELITNLCRNEYSIVSQAMCDELRNDWNVRTEAEDLSNWGRFGWGRYGQKGDKLIEILCHHYPEREFPINDVICHKFRSKRARLARFGN